MNKYSNQTDKYDAIIEEDESVGFYLYIYDKNTNKCLFDFLQDTLEIAKAQAQRDFSFDPQNWIKVG